MTEVRTYRTRPVEVESMGPLTHDNIGEIVDWHNRVVPTSWSQWRARVSARSVSIHYDSASIHGDPLVRAGQRVVLIWSAAGEPHFVVMDGWFTDVFTDGRAGGDE